MEKIVRHELIGSIQTTATNFSNASRKGSCTELHHLSSPPGKMARLPVWVIGHLPGERERSEWKFLERLGVAGCGYLHSSAAVIID